MERIKAERKAREMLAQMTLEEKNSQLNQAGTTMICTLPGIETNIDTWFTIR